MNVLWIIVGFMLIGAAHAYFRGKRHPFDIAFWAFNHGLVGLTFSVIVWIAIRGF